MGATFEVGQRVRHKTSREVGVVVRVGRELCPTHGVLAFRCGDKCDPPRTGKYEVSLGLGRTSTELGAVLETADDPVGACEREG